MRFPSLAAIAALAVLTSCGGSEIARLEQEQKQLAKQVGELKGTIGELRAEMVEAGLLAGKQGKAKEGASEDAQPEGKGAKAKRRGKDDDEDEGEGEGASFGHVAPANDLKGALSVQITRTGTPPELPALQDLEQVESVCGHKFVLRGLQPLSDFPLNVDGFGKAGPVLMFEDGKPMKAHASPAEYQESCAGAFRHAGFAFLFSPTGDAASAKTRKYTLGLQPDVPMARGDDGKPVYWVYPGTTLTIAVSDGWDAAWGELDVTVGGRIALPGASAATIRVAQVEFETPEVAAPEALRAAKVIGDPPSGPFTIEITSPEDGPYLLLGDVTLGNDENALVVTRREPPTAPAEGRPKAEAE